MLARRGVMVVAILIGAALEIGIHAASGRREAWDSALYWTIGLPAALVLSTVVGFVSHARAWMWTWVLIPSQVGVMMLRSGEIGALWPLTVLLSGFLSAPFVIAAFVGSRFRPARYSTVLPVRPRQ